MRVFLAVLLSLPMLNLPAAAEIEASGELPANALDLQGDTIGGIGSGIVYDAKNDVFLCVSDRGPGDGAIAYRPRVVVLKLTQSGDRLTPEVVETVILRDEKGVGMTGLIPDDPEASTPRMKDGRTCIDPEAIALTRDGRLYITDEYGPYLYEFQRDGTMVRRITLPGEFQPKTAAGKLDFTDKADLVSGRAINQGPEGMCLLPDGKHAALIFQSASVQDGGKAAGTTKLLVLDLAEGKPTAMYRYPMSPSEAGVAAKKLSINDLAALDEHRFLVLERDGQGRDGGRDSKQAGYKSVWLADMSGATNLLTTAPTGSARSEAGGQRPVSATSTDGNDSRPSGDRFAAGKSTASNAFSSEDRNQEIALGKTLLFNLPSLVKNPETLAAKWEGLAIIPPSDEKQITLLMTADNDFLTPVIQDGGAMSSFARAKDPVPTQFFKIRVPLPENP